MVVLMQNPLDLDPDTEFTRRQLAEALSQVGFPISKGSLANMACRGNGPPFGKFRKYPIYRWGDALAWAQSLKTPASCSTAEHKAARRAQAT